MFEKVLPKNTLKIIKSISSKITDFYLAGGTGLALQIGHRNSADLDFFSPRVFNTEFIIHTIKPDKVFLVREGTIHCELQEVKLSFLFYQQPLTYSAIKWKSLHVADYRDIAAEKFKTISQRGSKKDFYDLYAVLKMKLSIDEACIIFKERFYSSGINMYHVLKGITFFEDAEYEPSPMLVKKGVDWGWGNVKKYFEKNIKQFEKNLLT